jgi:hypothetical protein
MDTEVGGGRKLKVTMSFGTTELGPDDDADSVLKRADDALYVSKDGGRNMVSVRTAADDAADAETDGGQDTPPPEDESPSIAEATDAPGTSD